MSGCLRLRPSTVDLTHAAGLEHEALRWAHRTGLAVWERRLAGRRIEAVLAKRHLWSSISSGAPRRPPLRDESRLSVVIEYYKKTVRFWVTKKTRGVDLGVVVGQCSRRRREAGPGALWPRPCLQSARLPPELLVTRRTQHARRATLMTQRHRHHQLANYNVLATRPSGVIGPTRACWSGRRTASSCSRSSPSRSRSPR